MKSNAEHSLIKVHFDDWGQDLLWMAVDVATTKVIDCGPFHKSIYIGKYVFCPASLYESGHLDYSDTPIVELDQDMATIKYRIVKIEAYEPR